MDLRSKDPRIDRLLDWNRYNRKINLDIMQWELVNQEELELCRNTCNPHRNKIGNPHVLKSKDRLNAMLRSYAIHLPEWTPDTLREMFRMSDKSAFSVDDQNPSGVRIPYFKRLPYLNLLGREFTLTGREAGIAVVVKKNQVLLPEEDKILRMRRIRHKAQETTLPRYPFRILTPLESESERNVFRPTYSRILVKGIHTDQAVQISGRRLCRKLCDKETGEITIAAPGSRVCFDESQTSTRFEIIY